MIVPNWTSKYQLERYGTEMKQRIIDVMDRGQYILSKEVSLLEERIADYLSVKYSIGVASGSDALYISILAMGFSPNSEIITTPYTFFASTSCITRNNLKPVFIDVDYDKYNLDPSNIESAITNKTKAVLTVDLFSHTPDYDKICELAAKHNLEIIEDSAEGFGMKWKDTFAGKLGKVGVFSFFPSKTLGAFGDGGMIVTNNKELAEMVRTLRAHGAKPKYHHARVGVNSRLDELQAAVLNVKLDFVDDEIKERELIASEYIKRLKTIDKVKVPQIEQGATPVWYVYSIKCENRDSLQTHLSNNGIQTEVFYPVPMHLQECFRHLGYSKGCFPTSERLTKESLALPIYPGMSLNEIKYVCDMIEKFYV